MQVLVKPASGQCNMRCRYCFYADETNHREAGCTGWMSEQTLESLIRNVLTYSDQQCILGFQGGEPTLRGLDFYKRLIQLEKQYNFRNVEITHLFQTNGLLLDDAWAEFFRENHFLIGLSMDGTQRLHDHWRTDTQSRGTYDRVLAAARLLQKHQVDFNILTVVTGELAAHPQEVYLSYMAQGLLYQQYIPCLDPIGQPRGTQSYSLTPEQYGDFLIGLFDAWYADRSAGKFVYIQYFEELAGMMLGLSPQSCGLQGLCSQHLVVEADGSTYPCDFYMLDNWYLGNITQQPIPELLYSPTAQRFLADSWADQALCRGCPYLRLCHGGCRRDRQDLLDPKKTSRNYYCKSYQRFLQHAAGKLGMSATAYP